jgi:hypothetical protein
VCDAEKSNRNELQKSAPMSFAATKKKTKKLNGNEMMKNHSPKRQFSKMEWPYPFPKVKKLA